jgi:hypothetical protein
MSKIKGPHQRAKIPKGQLIDGKPASTRMHVIPEKLRPELLKKIAEWRGVNQSLRDLNISMRIYVNTIRLFPDFYLEVQSARDAANDYIVEQVYAIGLGTADPDVLMRLVDRHDRAKKLDNENRHWRAEQKMKKLEIETAAGNSSADQGLVDFTCLTKDKRAELRSILKIVFDDSGTPENEGGS